MFKFKNSNSTGLSELDYDDPAALKGLSNLYDPQEHPKTRARDIADVLKDSGKIDDSQLAQIRQKQSKSSGDAGAILQELQLVNADEILSAKASLYGFEFRHVEPEQVDKEIF